MERLQKYLSSCGVASRRKSEELILNGKVKINGKVVRELGVQVNSTDIVCVDDIEIKKEDKVYYINFLHLTLLLIIFKLSHSPLPKICSLSLLSFI